MSATRSIFDDDDVLPVAAPKDPYASIPDEMKKSRSWLVYKTEPGVNGRQNKIPYGVKSGRKENDPTKGASFEEAKAVVKDYSGLGFYVEPPYICLDIDDCVDKEGLVADYAAEIVREMNTFAELSPSSTGIHIWAKGEKPGTACRRGIEIYGTRRFMTICANPIPDMPCEVRTVDIKPVYDRMLRGDFVEPEAKPATTETLAASTSSKEFGKIKSVGTAITTKLRLLSTGKIISTKPFIVEDEQGRDIRYQSQSEADQALCNELAREFSGDADKIDQAFRDSSLYRAKWDREDYRKRTVKSAVDSYNNSEQKKSAAPASAVEVGTADWRQKFNRVGDLQTGGVPMLIEGFLPQGISMIGALPGEGKTLFALSLSKALSTGKPFLGRFPVPKPVPVLYLTPESSGAAFRKRCEMFGIPSSDMFLVRTISQGPTLLLDDPAIKAAVIHMHPVVILDTAIRFNKSTDENSATANKIFADEVNALISCGALAVTGLHHANKSSRKDGLTQESALRGTGDLAAICDAVYGLKRNEALYDSGRGALELEVSCLKSRDFDPPTPFVIAATAKVADKIVSNIDTTGDFISLGIGDLLNSIDTRFAEIVALDPFISYGDLGMKLSISKSQAQNLAKKLKYRKTPAGWKQSSLTTSVSEDPKASQDVQEEKE